MAKTVSIQVVNGETYEIMDATARASVAAEATAREAAVSAEATAREAAVAAEATARDAAIGAEATARDEAVAAEADARAMETSNIKTAIRDTAFDIMAIYGDHTPGTHNGVTFTSDGSVWTVNGTATNTAFKYIYSSSLPLPPGIVAGKEAFVYCKSSNATKLRCVMFYYDGDNQQIGTTVYINSKRTIHIPDNCAHIQARIQLESGTTADNATIDLRLYPSIIDNVPYQEFPKKYTSNRLLSVGNSILTGIVYPGDGTHYSAGLNDAPYSIIAKALNVNSPEDISHTILSSAGLLYDAGHGSFLDNIKQMPLDGYNYLLTHLFQTDMRGQYYIGSLESEAGDGSIAGAVKELANYVRATNPKCDLVLIGIPPTSLEVAGNEVFTGHFNNGANIAMVDELLHKLAAELHFIYVDWQQCDISYHYHDFTPENDLHANSPEVYHLMGNYIADHLAYETDKAESKNRTVVTGNQFVVNNDTEEDAIVDVGEADNVLVAGRNIFRVPPRSTSYTDNGVTWYYDPQNGTIRAVSQGATGIATGYSYKTTVNGIPYGSLYTFTLNEDAYVTFSLNPSIHLDNYKNKVRFVVSAGSESQYSPKYEVSNIPLTFLCKQNIEYSVRIQVYEDFVGDVTFRPQVEIAKTPSDFEPFIGAICSGSYGSKFDFNGGPTYGRIEAQSGAVWMTYSKDIMAVHPGAANAASALYQHSIDTPTIDGYGFGYLYKKSFSVDADFYLELKADRNSDRVYGQARYNGSTKLIPLNTPVHMTIAKNKEFGIRLYVDSGEAEPEIGIKLIFDTGIYSLHGNDTVTVISDNPVELSYCEGEAKLAPEKGEKLITITDDDTSRYNAIQLFHDALTVHEIPGTYVCITDNVEKDERILPLLLEYQNEGFAVVTHCKEQAASGETDYFFPATRDRAEVINNIASAKKKLTEWGFFGANHWGTPNGVNDDEIIGIARMLGFDSLLSAYYNTYNRKDCQSERHEVLRTRVVISDVNTRNRLKALIDSISDNGGWIIITTHAYQYTEDTETYQDFIDEVYEYASERGLRFVNYLEGFNTYYNKK